MASMKEHVVALNEARIRLAREQESYIDDCQRRHPGETFTAEERAYLDATDGRIAEYDAEICKFVEREERESSSAASREIIDRLTTEQPTRKAQDANELRSLMSAPRGSNPSIELDLRGVQHEKDLLRAGWTPAEVRALYSDTGNVGSAVPTTLARTLYEYMEASVAMFRMPTSKINTSTGEALQFPRLSAHSIGTQVISQGTAIGGTDPGFARMQLDAYKYGQLVAVASEALQDTAVPLEQFIGRDIGRGLGRLVDADLVVGTGTGEPNGIITASTGSVTTGGSLIAPTYEKWVDMVHSVPDEYRYGGAAAWLMRDLTIATVRKLRDGAGGTTGAVMWEPSPTNGLTNGQPDRFLGFPVYGDPNVASLASNARAALFGDVSAYYVRQVGGLVIERDDSYGFNTDLVYFRGKGRWDGDLIDANAVSVLIQNV
jgi:HK97 family phage major capsid protein